MSNVNINMSQVNINMSKADGRVSTVICKYGPQYLFFFKRKRVLKIFVIIYVLNMCYILTYQIITPKLFTTRLSPKTHH